MFVRRKIHVAECAVTDLRSAKAVIKLLKELNKGNPVSSIIVRNQDIAKRIYDENGGANIDGTIVIWDVNSA